MRNEDSPILAVRADQPNLAVVQLASEAPTQDLASDTGPSHGSNKWWYLHLLVVALGVLCLLASIRLTYLRDWTDAFYPWAAGVGILLLWGSVRSYRSFRLNPFDTAAILSVFTVAVALRLSFDPLLLPGSIDGDELLMAEQSTYLGSDFTRSLRLYWVGLPIFGLVPQALAFRLIEPGIETARWTHGIFGALAVVAVYDLGKNLLNRRVGLAAAFLLAVSASLIGYSRTGLTCVQTPTYATFMMAFLVRALNGGAFITWIAASISMGFGIMAYQAGYLLPITAVLSSLPWLLDLQIRKIKIKPLFCLTFIVAIGLLIAAPPYTEIFVTIPLDSGGRNADLLISASKLESLAKWYLMPNATPTQVFMTHAYRAITLPWMGIDYMPMYGGNFGLTDSSIRKCLYLIPLFVLWRRRVGWICLVWIATYITLGALLCAVPITFHRLLASIPFLCLAAASLVDLVLPRRLAILALIVFCGISAHGNLEYYFIRRPIERPLSRSSLLAYSICPYAKTHTIRDASLPEGSTPDPRYTSFIRFECAPTDYRPITQASEIWNLGEVNTQKVLLIVKTIDLSKVGITPPPHYSIVKLWKDDRATFPEYLSLTFIELAKS